MTAPIPTPYPHPHLPINQKMQDRVKAEGWRPPLVQVTTEEALGLLPIGVIVKADGPYAYHRDRLGWFRTGHPSPMTPPVPVTVLWTPEVDG